MSMQAGFCMVAASRFVLLSEPLVIALVVFFIVFAFAMIWAALWYNTRQDKQVRTDQEGDDDLDGMDDDFVMRPGERETDGFEAGDEEEVEAGTQRFRRA
jgi:hypothetical protein